MASKSPRPSPGRPHCQQVCHPIHTHTGQRARSAGVPCRGARGARGHRPAPLGTITAFLGSNAVSNRAARASRSIPPNLHQRAHGRSPEHGKGGRSDTKEIVSFGTVPSSAPPRRTAPPHWTRRSRRQAMSLFRPMRGGEGRGGAGGRKARREKQNTT